MTEHAGSPTTADQPVVDPGAGVAGAAGADAGNREHPAVQRSLAEVRITSRDGLPLAAGLAAEAADLLGLSAADQSRLRAIVQEVAEAVVQESFETSADLDLSLRVDRRAGGLAVVLRDHGAPSGFANGNYPPRIADLIRLGFADSLETHNEGRAGNRTQLTKALRYASVGEDEHFQASTRAHEPDSLNDPDSIEVRPMSPDDVIGVARLFYRCYGYSNYYAPVIYEPDHLAELVAADRHFATIAVTPAGRVVAHVASEIASPDAVTSKIGLLAVDPDYRGMHLSAKTGLVHIQRLLARGMVGQFSEGVTIHNRSQKAALAAGGHEVGMLLAAQRPSLDMKGFEGEPDLRRAVMMLYAGLGQAAERRAHLPPEYLEVAERIYSEANLPRRVEGRYRRSDPQLPPRTEFRQYLKQESGVAFLTVLSYGSDFLTSMQEQLQSLRLNRFDLILVFLRLDDPLTGQLGSGLHELGLSFAGIYPEYDDGDVLVLQSLNNVEIDPDAIAVASPLGEYLRDFVVADYRAAGERRKQRSRSQARMSRIYEALQ